MSDAYSYVKRLPITNQGARVVAIALSEHVDEHGWGAPSSKVLQEDAQRSARSVSYALECLEQDGFIRRERVYDARGKRAPDRILLVGFSEYRAELKSLTDKAYLLGAKSASSDLAQDLHLDQHLVVSAQVSTTPLRAKSAPALHVVETHKKKGLHTSKEKLQPNSNVESECSVVLFEAPAAQNKKTKPDERGEFISPDMELTDGLRAYAAERGFLNGTGESLFDEFKDYWLQNADPAKARKRDWNAAFRTWVRNAVKRREESGHGQRTYKANANDVARENRQRAAMELLAERRALRSPNGERR